jgi:hypothetical protein
LFSTLSHLFVNYNNKRSKPRPLRARPTTLPSNFCPAFTVCCAGFEVVGERVEDRVTFGAVVDEEEEEDDVETDSVVWVVELVVPVVELEDSVVVTVELEVPVVEVVGLDGGGMTLKLVVAPQSAREVPSGQQPALVQ